MPEFWSVEQAHDAAVELERRIFALPSIDGEIVFHVDPCMRALCASCDLPDCPVRQRAFVARPPLTLDEATRGDVLPDLRDGVHEDGGKTGGS